MKPGKEAGRAMTARKISIRFFDDAEVRAVWDDLESKWRFSVLDVVGVLRGEGDYEKIAITGSI